MAKIKSAFKKLEFLLWIIPGYAIWRIAKEYQEQSKMEYIETMKSIGINLRQIGYHMILDPMIRKRDEALASGDMATAMVYSDRIDEAAEEFFENEMKIWST